MPLFRLTLSTPLVLIDLNQGTFLEDVGYGSHDHYENRNATGRGEIERVEHAPLPEAVSGMMQTMSRIIYSGSYTVAYGVVYAGWPG
jgi:hypothetical protein